MTDATRLADDNLTLMHAVHDALRRDLGHLATAASRPPRPGRWPGLIAGWRLFARQLHLHHSGEDATLWPAMRRHLYSRDELALLDDMAAEHARVDPLVAVVDDALTAGEPGWQRSAVAVDELHGQLTAHLRHEEQQALPLARRVLDAADWRAGAARARREQGLRGAADFFPWLLDAADPNRARQVLALLPTPLRTVHRLAWQPRYRRAARWA